MLFGVVYYQYVWLNILHDDPLTPLTLAHVRDSSDDMATSTAGAPTMNPVQDCLQIHLHLYQSFQRSGIDAYLIPWCTHCAVVGLCVLFNLCRVHVICANDPPFWRTVFSTLSTVTIFTDSP